LANFRKNLRILARLRLSLTGLHLWQRAASPRTATVAGTGRKHLAYGYVDLVSTYSNDIRAVSMDDSVAYIGGTETAFFCPCARRGTMENLTTGDDEPLKSL
jgi:hypothetical protein